MGIFLHSIGKQTGTGISRDVEYIGSTTAKYNKNNNPFLFDLYQNNFSFAAKCDIGDAFRSHASITPLVVEARLDEVTGDIQVTKHLFKMDQCGDHDNWNWNGVLEQEILAKVTKRKMQP